MEQDSNEDSDSGGRIQASSLSGAIGIRPGGAAHQCGTDLSVTGFPGVYAWGDFVECRRFPMASRCHSSPPLAQQAGKHCADT